MRSILSDILSKDCWENELVPRYLFYQIGLCFIVTKFIHIQNKKKQQYAATAIILLELIINYRPFNILTKIICRS